MIPLTPEQNLTLRSFSDIERQARATLLKLHTRTSPEVVRRLVDILVSRHDALHLYAIKSSHGWEQRRSLGTPVINLSILDSLEGLSERPTISPSKAPMMYATYIRETDGDYIYLAFHHLICDRLAVSFFVSELDQQLGGAELHGQPQSFVQWVEKLTEPLEADELIRLRKRWEQEWEDWEPPRRNMETGHNRLEDARSVTVVCNFARARAAARLHHSVIRMDYLILSAVLQAYGTQFDARTLHVCIGYNGRTEAAHSMSSTAKMVGLAVTHYYAVLKLPEGEADMANAYGSVSNQLGTLPPPSTFGRVFDATRAEDRSILERLSMPVSTFIYQPPTTANNFDGVNFTEVTLPVGAPRTGPRNPDFSLIVNARGDEQCAVTCVYSPFQYNKTTIVNWLEAMAGYLER